MPSNMLTRTQKLFSKINAPNMILIVLLASFITVGCSIEKRRYTSGFYIPRSSHSLVKTSGKDIKNHTDETRQNDNIENHNINLTILEKEEYPNEEIDSSTAAFKRIPNASEIGKATSSIQNNLNPGLILMKKKAHQVDNEPIKSQKLEALKVIKDSQELSSMALAGFICSLAGFLFFLIFGFPFFLALLGVIFSGIGLHQTLKGGKSGKGFAIAGLAVGIVTMILGWIWLIFIGTLLAATF